MENNRSGNTPVNGRAPVASDRQSDRASEDVQRLQYLSKLWNTVFDEGTAGLLSPHELVHSSRGHRETRSQELATIRLAEKDLEAVHSGRKRFDETGKIVDAPLTPNEIEMNPIIETSQVDQYDSELRLGADALIKHISYEVRIKELKRSLHLRKVMIFAESSAMDEAHKKISPRPVDLDWLGRWRDYAQDSHGEVLQKQWGRLLAREVRKPGSISIRALDFFRHLGSQDAQLIAIASRLSFGDFIYREAKGYFTDEIHQPMFETLEELGLILGVQRKDLWADIAPKKREFQPMHAVLRCHNKALFIEMPYSGQAMNVPVYKITQLGKEVMNVALPEADMAYLWAVANDLKASGCVVHLGDWLEKNDTQGAFQQKITL